MPTSNSRESRSELDSLISRLVDRPSSAILRDTGDASPRRSRPNSVLSGGQLSGDNTESFSSVAPRPTSHSIATQTTDTEISVSEPTLVPAPRPEIVTYSKGVQTDEWAGLPENLKDGTSDSEEQIANHNRRRQREKDEEIRQRLKREIEEELKATRQQVAESGASLSSQVRYPLRLLTDDEVNAVTSSDDFLDFVDNSSKVIERALDEEYDVLADYGLGGLDANGEIGDYAGSEESRDIKESIQFWDERQSKKRMISDVNFSPWVCLCVYSMIPLFSLFL